MQQVNNNPLESNQEKEDPDEPILDMNNPTNTITNNNPSLEQNNKFLAFQTFAKETNLRSSPFVSFYEEVLKDNRLRMHLNFVSDDRIEFLNLFPYKYKTINKPFLNNIFISNVDELIGYTYLNNDHKVYVVALSFPNQLSPSDYPPDAMGMNKIIVPESIIFGKLKSKLIKGKLLDNTQSLHIN